MDFESMNLLLKRKPTKKSTKFFCSNRNGTYTHDFTNKIVLTLEGVTVLPNGRTQEHHWFAVELIKSYGYPVEVYEDIKTDDGYLITLYRIPYGKGESNDSKRPVVLLMHGVLSNSADYVISGPNRSLALLLSDRGYDVWLVNSRGASVSLKHTTLKHDQHMQYWRFSFHHMGIYDYPAIFNQIEKVTSLKTLSCIVQSQGAAVPFVLLSEKPEFNDRINLIIAVNPAVCIRSIRSIPYRMLYAGRYILEEVLEKRGILQFPPTWINKLLFTFRQRAQENTWLQKIFIQFLYILHGRTPKQLVEEDVPVMMRYYPDTTSLFVLKHLSQTMEKGSFTKYDYGLLRNLEEYGTPEPPPYDLNNVKCPVALMCSSGDLVVNTKDVHELAKKLPNCIAVEEMENPAFNHSDFLYGRYSVDVAYPFIFKYLSEYSQAK